MAIKPPRPHQSWVQAISPIGASYNHHISAAVESCSDNRHSPSKIQPLESTENLCGGKEPTIHFNKQLVEGVFLLALVTSTGSAPLPAHRINLINEKDAGGVFTSQGEHVSYLKTDRMDK